MALKVTAFVVIAMQAYFPATSAPANEVTSGSCGPSQAKTLSEGGRIRVYTRASSGPSRGGVYGCQKPSGRSLRVGPAALGGRFSASYLDRPIGLAAPWVGAFEHRTAGQDGFFVFAVSRNLEAGARRQCFVGGADHPFSAPGKVLLNREGDMGWAAVAPGTNGMVEVAVCGSAGRRVVATGSDIHIDSVKLEGSLLSWTDSESTKSTRI
jgi:hypothetical protein